MSTLAKIKFLLFIVAIMDFHRQLWVKKLETTFSVLIMTLGSEKLQFYKIYMKSWVMHELLHNDIH